MPTEKEKMLAGEYYKAMDPQLAADRLSARNSLFEYNNAKPDQFAERATILRSLLGSVHKTAYIEPPFRCDYGYNIFLGKRFYANFGCIMLDVNPIEIGDDVKLGPSVELYTAGHPVDPIERKSLAEFGKPIKIGNNVWIGGKSIILPGVEIGDNTVIGAGSVVTKSIPSNVIAVGNPCRVLRSL